MLLAPPERHSPGTAASGSSRDPARYCMLGVAGTRLVLAVTRAGDELNEPAWMLPGGEGEPSARACRRRVLLLEAPARDARSRASLLCH